MPKTDQTRRTLLLGAGAAVATASLPMPALALDEAQAQALVTALTTDILKSVNSGKTGNALYRDFEKILARYADMNIVARTALGADARRASPAQLRSFTTAFSGYIARKYGKRFAEFYGATMEVRRTRKVRSYFEVRTRAKLQGQSPFEVTFLVSNRSGENKFFNLLIEGVNLLLSERAEIGALLDRNQGNIDAMTAQLRKLG